MFINDVFFSFRNIRKSLFNGSIEYLLTDKVGKLIYDPVLSSSLPISVRSALGISYGKVPGDGSSTSYP